MLCPRCKHGELSVIDSRDCDGEAVRRRRECVWCTYRFTTYERIEPVKITILKRDGTTEPYQRDKLLRGIRLALEKRPIASQTIDELLDQIEQKLLTKAQDKIPSRVLGNLVIRSLRRLDPIAYIRFASVYRNFENLEAFEKELAKIRKR